MKPNFPVFQAIKAQDGAGSSNVVAATTGRQYYVQSIVIGVQAHDNTGIVELTDGTTTLFGPFLLKDGNGHPPAFYNENGIKWGKSKAIVVKVTTAGTVNVMVNGYYK
jgi:hypothetical protein